MRTLAAAAVLGFALALAACTQADQTKAEAETHQTAADLKTGAKEVGQDVEQGVRKAGAEIKDVTDDPNVKAAASEAKDALKGLGSAIKDAARDEKAATTTSSTTTHADGSTTTTTTVTTTKR